LVGVHFSGVRRLPGRHFRSALATRKLFQLSAHSLACGSHHRQMVDLLNGRFACHSTAWPRWLPGSVGYQELSAATYRIFAAKSQWLFRLRHRRLTFPVLSRELETGKISRSVDSKQRANSTGVARTIR
jgi:hypothetical protein